MKESSFSPKCYCWTPFSPSQLCVFVTLPKLSKTSFCVLALAGYMAKRFGPACMQKCNVNLNPYLFVCWRCAKHFDAGDSHTKQTHTCMSFYPRIAPVVKTVETPHAFWSLCMLFVSSELFGPHWRLDSHLLSLHRNFPGLCLSSLCQYSTMCPQFCFYSLTETQAPKEASHVQLQFYARSSSRTRFWTSQHLLIVKNGTQPKNLVSTWNKQTSICLGSRL